MVKKYGMQPITTGSYLTAMNAMVDKFETKRRKVIFLIVTDEPVTVHKQMMPTFKK